MALLVLPKLASEHKKREEKLLKEALEKGRWRLTATACLLGLSPNTLHKALTRHPELEKRRLAQDIETTRRFSSLETLADEFREKERALLEEALVGAGWSVPRAAETLGVKPSVLYTLLRGRCVELGTRQLQETLDRKIGARKGKAA